VSNLYKLALPARAQHGRQHTLNLSAIARHRQSLKGSPNTESFHRQDYQSQQSTKQSEKSEGASTAGGCWICLTNSEYLAVLDKAGVLPMIKTYKVNDLGRAWAY